MAEFFKIIFFSEFLVNTKIIRQLALVVLERWSASLTPRLSLENTGSLSLSDGQLGLASLTTQLSLVDNSVEPRWQLSSASLTTRLSLENTGSLSLSDGQLGLASLTTRLSLVDNSALPRWQLGSASLTTRFSLVNNSAQPRWQLGSAWKTRARCLLVKYCLSNNQDYTQMCRNWIKSHLFFSSSQSTARDYKRDVTQFNYVEHNMDSNRRGILTWYPTRILRVLSREWLECD